VVKTDEGYVGIKFRVVYASRNPPQNDQLSQLIDWCRRWAALGLTGKAMGNLSFRTPAGFIITPTGTDPVTITASQFVEVLRANPVLNEVTVTGACEPSSECMMHAGIYEARPDIGAVFHGHSPAILAAGPRLGLVQTEREVPYGTPAMVAEVLKVLGSHNFFLMRNHGFVSLGATMAEAGWRLEEVLAKV
jgi:ribulose-5-phosphate 4-epimerase/fuculose-1-phosphate aldolase